MKKEKRKYISPWKGLTICGLIFSLFFGIASTALSMTESLVGVINIAAGDLWQPINKDPSAIYYS